MLFDVFEWQRVHTYLLYRNGIVKSITGIMRASSEVLNSLFIAATSYCCSQFKREEIN